jgi:tetratricopeptide (TPR) repeat protein
MCMGWLNGVGNRSIDFAETQRLAERAVQLGWEDDAQALSRAGYALASVVGDLDRGAGLIDRALALNPNLAEAWRHSGWTKAWLGEPDLAIVNFAQSMRLNPLDPLLYIVQAGMAYGHFFAGRYNEAASWVDRSLGNTRSQPFTTALRMMAASQALAGRLEEAQKPISRLLSIDPEHCIAKVLKLSPIRRPQDIARYAEGLRLAGLPE